MGAEEKARLKKQKEEELYQSIKRQLRKIDDARQSEKRRKEKRIGKLRAVVQTFGEMIASFKAEMKKIQGRQTLALEKIKQVQEQKSGVNTELDLITSEKRISWLRRFLRIITKNLVGREQLLTVEEFNKIVEKARVDYECDKQRKEASSNDVG